MHILNRFGAIYVTAMDGMASITDAHSILVTAVGQAHNTGMQYEQTKVMSRLGSVNWHLKTQGTEPALMEAIIGKLIIRANNPGRLKCWTLGVTGKRRERVPLRVEKGHVVLSLKARYKTVYYELAEK